MSSSLSVFKQARLVLFRRHLMLMEESVALLPLLCFFSVAVEAMCGPRSPSQRGTAFWDTHGLVEFRGVGFNRYFGIYWKAFKLNQRLIIKWDYKVGILLMIDSTAGRKLPQWSINMYLLWLAADDSKKLFLEAFMFELQNQFFGPRPFSCIPFQWCVLR